MFKSYTRKSSAVVGAKRAGLSEESVVNVDGSWGFYVNEEPVAVPKPEAQIHEIVSKILKVDRRKVLRSLNKLQSLTRRDNKRSNYSNEVVVKDIRRMQSNLRNGYRAAQLSR